MAEMRWSRTRGARRTNNNSTNNIFIFHIILGIDIYTDVQLDFLTPESCNFASANRFRNK